MHRTLAVLAFCGAAACVATSARAADGTGWFLNSAVGSAHYSATFGGNDSFTQSRTGTQLNFGYRWEGFGVEAGFTTLGNVKQNDGLGDSFHMDGKGWTLGVNSRFNPMRNPWYVSGRAGIFGWTLDASALVVNGNTVSLVSGRDTGTNTYVGLGTGWDFARNWSLGANADFYRIDTRDYAIDTVIYSVSVELRF